MGTIYKKGDKPKCENYHDIAVIGSMRRVYSKIIKNRIVREYINGSRKTSRFPHENIYNRPYISPLLFGDLKKYVIESLDSNLESTNINIVIIETVKTLYEQPIRIMKTKSQSLVANIVWSISWEGVKNLETELLYNRDTANRYYTLPTSFTDDK